MAPLAGTSPEKLANEVLSNATKWSFVNLAPKLATDHYWLSPPTTAWPFPAMHSSTPLKNWVTRKSTLSTSPPIIRIRTTALHSSKSYLIILASSIRNETLLDLYTHSPPRVRRIMVLIIWWHEYEAQTFPQASLNITRLGMVSG